MLRQNPTPYDHILFGISGSSPKKTSQDSADPLVHQILRTAEDDPIAERFLPGPPGSNRPLLTPARVN
jgi:hypothetical protein